ncbi:COG1123 ATPase components of various ABC-type transport systems, contain duplicated ATPase [Paracoccaceae bacterium]
MAETPLLQITDLHIDGQTGPNWLPIVRGIDLTLRPGEVLGLIGESGAGKSTLGLAAMGYVRGGCRISGGSIVFDGQELVGAAGPTLRALRGRRIAYVAQSAAASFNPARRLIDQFTEGPLIHGTASRPEAEAEAVALFEALQLPDPDTIGFRYPHQVSGGQLQRAMTAMAMACKPDLIIFDEPTTALDVTTQIDVLASIRKAVRDFGTAAIYITHDLAVVAQMADRIMVLRHGRLVEEAQTRTMLSDPKEAYTASLWSVRSFRATPKSLTAQPPILDVRAITAAYGRKTVLEDVSLQVGPGETVAVVGESGSGKSTLARVITGLLPPQSGQILLDGKLLPGDFRKRRKQDLRATQMIYQIPDTALNPRQSVAQIIARPARHFTGLSGRALQDRVCELLRLIDLDPAVFASRLPGELSGGQKQRVGIARALAAEPRLIICDEVTSALDQLVAEGILRLLDRLQQELGISYLFITHDIATVRAMADRVVVMQHGRVVESGPREEIFSPPHNPYTELLLSSVPDMDPDWLTHTLERRTGGRTKG